MYALARPLLFALDAEVAHRVTLSSVRVAHRLGLLGVMSAPQSGQPIDLMGLTFTNRIGLAAGFDKNGTCVDAMGALGFGFVEVGTVTPKPQEGNPKPRIFRLPRARAVVNRMGFPNEGAAAAVLRLRRRRFTGVCGVNIGKNAATPLEQATADYVAAFRCVYEYADYVTINISSPNTQGLRQLQQGEQLRPLLQALLQTRAELAERIGWRVPLVVKLSPDLAPDALAATAQVIGELALDGVIATNTTLDRAAVTGLKHADRPGGLSGEPLRERARAVVHQLRTLLGPDMPLIGVGGIASAADAAAMFAAGADLIQIYTGLIYRGPALVRELVAADRHNQP
ncbi:MAG TPA: quinone-dependent dihydroorotate dehydrogenase [Steroidobacteraceae bacterium]|jgi:dihydroorotate dehydrogenase|nr:quinone-dependent dihydroorotate dehydrogenase [Steroidobacteraceae bacterium]